MPRRPSRNYAPSARPPESARREAGKPAKRRKAPRAERRRAARELRARPAARARKGSAAGERLTVVPAAAQVSIEAAAVSRASLAAFVFGALAICLLALAAVPPWVVRRPSMVGLLVEWRVQVAAAGFSTLFVAGIVFLIGTSSL